MLTPTLKLRRSVVEARYAGDVRGWHARAETIVFAAGGGSG
jgi:hypothetical protein